ncbi:MAG: dTDP-4-dehydrorhamnose reductase [Salinibacter sp.]
MPSSDAPTILLIGATGQIGHALRAPLSALGSVVAPDRDALDLTAPGTIRDAVRGAAPDVIVNAAAYTAVDRAEEEPERAAAVNARAPDLLAEAAAAVGAWLVHYSTDYVFDGTSETPYTEAAPPAPTNVYGRTKRKGELAVQESAARALVLRTSWVYSARRANFLRSMLRLADEHDTLTVVDDQTGTPTRAGWIAEATAAVLGQVLETGGPGGLYHLAASGQTSWYGFATAIFAQFGRDDVTVEPIPTEEHPTPAARPAYTVLDSSKARTTFSLSIPTWSEQLAALRRQMTAETAS